MYNVPYHKRRNCVLFKLVYGVEGKEEEYPMKGDEEAYYRFAPGND